MTKQKLPSLTQEDIHREFDKVDAAVDQAVAVFVGKIERLEKGGVIHPAIVIERTLLRLCEEMTKLIDDEVVASGSSKAALKLSNAMADYRDSRCVDLA